MLSPAEEHLGQEHNTVCMFGAVGEEDCPASWGHGYLAVVEDGEVGHSNR